MPGTTSTFGFSAFGWGYTFPQTRDRLLTTYCNGTASEMCRTSIGSYKVPFFSRRFMASA
jgi:hypothetical protein